MPWICWWSVSKPARGWTPLSSEWRRICRKAVPIISQELLLVNLEIMAGLERQQALKNLGERTGVEELVSLCEYPYPERSLRNQYRSGPQNSIGLHSHRPASAKLEAMAAKTPVKLLFPMLLFTFPAIMVVILGPAIIKLSEFFSKGG